MRQTEYDPEKDFRERLRAAQAATTTTENGPSAPQGVPEVERPSGQDVSLEADFQRRLEMAGEGTGDPVEGIPEPAPGVGNIADNPRVDPVSPGAHPFVRAQAQFLSDDPVELNRWADRHYGEGSYITQGRNVGITTPDDPKGNSWYLREGYEGDWRLFDPTQATVVSRAGDAPFSRFSEIGAETIELAPTFITEGMLEAGLLIASRGATGGRILTRLARLRDARPMAYRGVRGAGYAGATGLAAGSGSFLEQIAQEYAGTQAQDTDEQIQQIIETGAYAGGLSALGSGGLLVGSRVWQTVFGKATPEGAAALEAARQFNERFRSGEMSSREFERLSAPLAGYITDQPTMKRVFQYLARLTPEINEFQRNYRRQLRSLAEDIAMRTDDDAATLQEYQQALLGSLRDYGDELQLKIQELADAPSSQFTGMELYSYVGAFRDETRQTVNNAYQRFYDRAQADFGPDPFSLKYDFEPLRGVLRRQREDILGVEVRDLQPGEARRYGAGPGGVGPERRVERRVNLETGDRSAWNNYERIERLVAPVLSGERELKPQSIIRAIEAINDELGATEVADRGRSALVQTKQALEHALYTIPENNEGLGRDALQLFRNARDMYRERAEIIDRGIVQSIITAGDEQLYSRAAEILYAPGAKGTDNLRQLRDVIVGDGRQITGIPGGEQKWEGLSNAYALYAVRRSGNPGRARETFESLPQDTREILFPTPERRGEIVRMLTEMDDLYNAAGFQRVAEMNEAGTRYVSNLINTVAEGRSERAERATDLMRNVLERANASGNPLPQRAFEAGVWQSLLDGSMRITPDGEMYLDPVGFGQRFQTLEQTGAMSLLTPEQRTNIQDFKTLLPASTFELSGGGAGIAAAEAASGLVDVGRFVDTVLDLGTARAASWILANVPTEAMYSRGAVRFTDLPTMLTRFAQYYSADQMTGNVTNEELRQYHEEMRRAADYAQRTMPASIIEDTAESPTGFSQFGGR